MKCLKIESGRGFFLKKAGEMESINNITKDDILNLLNIATSPETAFEMDAITDDMALNEAHKIIYRSLYSKFSELLENKTRFAEESASVYKDALEKYSI